MKRLRDEQAPTPLMRKAQQLIDAVDPVSESRERMLRIRRQLDQPRPRFAAIRRLPALALAALVVLFGASAFAAVRIFVERLAPAAAPAAPALSPAPALRSGAVSRAPALRGGAVSRAPALRGGALSPAPALRGGASMPAATVPVPAGSASAPTGSAPTSAAPSEPVLAAPKSNRGTTPARRTEPRVHAKPRPVVEAPIAATTDSVLVHRALKALRHDGNPALAARLLLENRAQNPGGPLAEEALSLQIEAASALHDAKAQQFAHEYLNRYPDGRYLSVARRALAEGL